jgi:hypothetical protein
MVPGTPIPDFMRGIIRDAQDKRDYVVPAQYVTVIDPDLNVSWDGGHTQAKFNKHAEGQLMTYLGIPQRFVERLREDAPDLIQINANRLLENKGADGRMIRELRGTVRAWLSSQYRRLDNEDVAERVMPMLEDNHYILRSASVTDTHLYLHAVSPHAEGEVRVGDPVRFGWIISNSEVGSGSLSIQLFVERLRCLNGMVLPEFSKRRAHIGGRSLAAVGVDSYLVAPSTETQRASDEALWGGVRDHIAEFMRPGGTQRVLARMQESAELPITGDPAAVVAQLSNTFNLREHESRSILYSYLEGGDHTRWGLSNSVTQVANTIGGDGAADYDRAVELERIGGELLLLGASREWKAIAEATAR